MPEMHAGLHVKSWLNMSDLNGFTVFHTILQYKMSGKSVQQFSSPTCINFMHIVQGMFRNKPCDEQAFLLVLHNNRETD
jgi:hypothetical protein